MTVTVLTEKTLLTTQLCVEEEREGGREERNREREREEKERGGGESVSLV